MSIQRIASSAIVPVVENNTGNILFRLQALICRINTQLSRLSEEGQTRSQTMKKEYRISSAKAADIQKRIGTSAPMFSGASFLTLLTGMAAASVFGVKVDQSLSFFKPVADQVVPSLGQWYSSNLSSEQMRESSISSLRQTEIGNEGQKSGEARDLQSELQQILANIRDLYKKACG
jgi:hypothetical protein